MISTETQPSSAVQKRSGLDWQEIIGYFVAVIMYSTFRGVYGALTGEGGKDGGDMIAVFLLVLTQYFMGWVPRLREQSLTFKGVALKWILVPVAYTALMSALLAGLNNLLD